jgi:hypothetical protein
VVISTQPADDAAPLSRLIGYGLEVKAKQIRDAGFHLTLRCADPDDDPWDLKRWRKPNPALSDFRSLEDVKCLAADADVERPASAGETLPAAAWTRRRAMRGSTASLLWRWPLR